MKKLNLSFIFFFLIITVINCSCQTIPDLQLTKQPVETKPAVTKKTPLPQLYNDGQGDFIILKREVGESTVLTNSAVKETTTIDLFDSQYFGLSLAPLGDRIAFWIDGYIFIFIINSDELIKINQERFGSFQHGQLAWLNESTQLATDCFPSENSLISEVCVVDIATGEIKALTDLTEFTTTFLSGVAIGGWSDKKNTLVFNLDIMPETSGYAKSIIFLIELDTLEKTLLFDERIKTEYSQIGLPRISKDGTKILFSAKTQNHSLEILLLDVQTGEVSQITPSNDNQHSSMPLWLDNNTFVVMQTNIEDEDIQTHSIYSISGHFLGFLELNEKTTIFSIMAIN